MNNLSIHKSLSIGVITYIVAALLSFTYGGIYTEIIIEGSPATFPNIMGSLFGALIIGVPFFFVGFAVSYVIRWLKDKWQQKRFANKIS